VRASERTALLTATWSRRYAKEPNSEREPGAQLFEFTVVILQSRSGLCRANLGSTFKRAENVGRVSEARVLSSSPVDIYHGPRPRRSFPITDVTLISYIQVSIRRGECCIVRILMRIMLSIAYNFASAIISDNIYATVIHLIAMRLFISADRHCHYKFVRLRIP
jgi:hypothetical protein